MGLASGTRIGPYEIQSLLGVGGMGEVYRARDHKLQRDVAIKVLPEAFSQDAERLTRFEREARTLASLNHPNIAAIYGVEETEGVNALVMELVQGPTLAERIAGVRRAGPFGPAEEAESIGPGLPLDEALPIAKQIAEALDAAHEKGVIHRDLKPANIKVTHDGVVKVLDFGLAKLNDPNASNDPNVLSQSPTITSPAMMTGVGMILGTAAYMSPEQARGKPVDKRADIWAFGCVLYEMLTGRRAFPGEDVTDTIVSVISKEPDWLVLPALTPAPVTSLLRRCLDKDPKRRLRDIGEARLALDGAALDEVGRVPRSGPAGSTGPGEPGPKGPGLHASWRRALPWAVASLFFVGLAVLSFVHFGETPPPDPPETRTEIVTPATADPNSFALSPDGRQIVFVASDNGSPRLWLRSLASTTAQPLAGTEGAFYPFWSPDGRSIGFSADAKLKRLDLGGGAPQTLATVTGVRGGTWNADGIILFAPTLASTVFRVPASGGEAVAVTKLDRQTSHRLPFFLPDGRRFLFYALGTADTQGIFLGSLESAETTQLTPADAAGVYLPSGWLLWVRAGTLVAQRLDLERKVLTGDPVTLADPVAFNANSAAGAVSVSAAGLVAYRADAASRRQLAWFDRSGKVLGPMGAPDDDRLLTPRVSPDGRRVAVFRGVQGNDDIWLLDGTRMSRFTFDAARDRVPIWSADGSRIVFDSNQKGHDDLYQKPSSGAGAEELLLESTQNKFATDWSADGRFILYLSMDPQTARDLWVLPMDGDRKPWVFLKTRFEERNGQFSPNGRWVAYESNESGRDEIYIRPFAVPSGTAANPSAGQWQVSTAGGIHPRWRPDGKELYYIGPTGEMMAAPITVRDNTPELGAPVTLFQTRIVGGGVELNVNHQYDVTRDGRFLINTVLDDASAPITLIQHWNPEAKP